MKPIIDPEDPVTDELEEKLTNLLDKSDNYGYMRAVWDDGSPSITTEEMDAFYIEVKDLEKQFLQYVRDKK
jgi:hypothetical protein